jgi:hypothetical protein
MRTVCGHAADQSDPSGDRQGEQERYISENGVFAQFTPELVDPLPEAELRYGTVNCVINN